VRVCDLADLLAGVARRDTSLRTLSSTINFRLFFSVKKKETLLERKTFKTKMSTAAEKAEARRRAILSRGNDRLSKLTTTARGEDGKAYVNVGTSHLT
jgi:hypothetical protein